MAKEYFHSNKEKKELEDIINKYNINSYDYAEYYKEYDNKNKIDFEVFLKKHNFNIEDIEETEKDYIFNIQGLKVHYLKSSFFNI